jgi:ribonuclease T1
MSPQDRRTVRTVLLVLACVLLVGLVWVGSRDSTTAEPGVQPGSGQPASGQSASSGQHRGTSGLPSVSVADLPPEARHTLELIRSDGPFPYSRDGVVFQNRERLLPREKSGYYHEYTVPTPGEADRGARRIITGKAGERYYTDDHYASFRVVEEQP